MKIVLVFMLFSFSLIGTNKQLALSDRTTRSDMKTPKHTKNSRALPPTAQPKVVDAQNATKTSQELKPSTQTLDARKLELEISQLEYGLSTSNKFEWVKAIGAFLTSLGIIGTLLIGISQQRQNRISRDDERFERSVTRLGSDQIAQRITGLAGIKPFLQSSEQSRQISALTYLINAGIIESDPTVRSAMEDIFENISGLALPTEVLNEGLIAARDRNRAVYKRATNAFFEKQNAAGRRLIDKNYTEVSIGSPSPSEMAPLEISAKMVAGLIRAGAKIDDLSDIYCAKCIFSSLNHPSELAGVNFDQAILSRADFAGARLAGASFHNTDLVLTSFIAADLSGSKLTADTALEPWSVSAAVYSGELWASYGAIFACADLSNADLSGRLVFSLIYENDTYGGNMRDEFYKANLAGAKMGSIRYALGIPSSKLAEGFDSRAFPLDLSPTEGVNFSKLTDPIHYFKDTLLVLFTTFGDLTDNFKENPNPYNQDLLITMSSIASARNVHQAELPLNIRRYIEANGDKLNKPFIYYNCKTGQKGADISGMFAKPGPMTGNARF